MKIPIKKERIFRILTLEENLTVSDIARKTELAKSYISKVVGDLRRKGIVWGTEKLQVSHIDILREWGDFKRTIFNKITPLVVDIFFPDKIKETLREYAVSGPFAEMLIQGESPGKPIVVYISESQFKKTERELKKLGKTGRGYAFFYVYDEDVFRGGIKIKGWNVASLPQVSADLVALGTYADLGIRLFKRWLDAGRRI